MTDKLTMSFFPAVASACGPAGGCECGPSDAAAVDPNEVLRQRAVDLQERYGGQLQIRVFDYSSEQDVAQAVETLNAALQRSGASPAVSRENLRVLLESMAPIVAVGDKVVFSRGVPPLERLTEHVEQHLAAV